MKGGKGGWGGITAAGWSLSSQLGFQYGCVLLHDKSLLAPLPALQLLDCSFGTVASVLTPNGLFFPDLILSSCSLCLLHSYAKSGGTGTFALGLPSHPHLLPPFYPAHSTAGVSIVVIHEEKSCAHKQSTMNKLCFCWLC